MKQDISKKEKKTIKIYKQLDIIRTISEMAILAVLNTEYKNHPEYEIQNHQYELIFKDIIKHSWKISEQVEKLANL